MAHDKTVDEICTALATVPEKFRSAPSGLAYWTFETKRVLTDLGHQKGYYVAGDRKAGADWGETGFDICWRDYGFFFRSGDSLKDKYLRSLPLACESELHNIGDVEDDFEKLLQSRGHIKLMIFAPKSKADMEKLNLRLAKAINEFEAGPASDVYILGCFPWKPAGFFYTVLDGSGQITDRSSYPQT
jgi:hypothetical protein